MNPIVSRTRSSVRLGGSIDRFDSCCFHSVIKKASDITKGRWKRFELGLIWISDKKIMTFGQFCLCCASNLRYTKPSEKEKVELFVFSHFVSL